MPKPRRPTLAEIAALSRIARCSEADVLDTAYVAVFDDYITDSPGYAGKLMMVVWSCGPSLYEVFTWNEQGEIERQPHDTYPTGKAQ